jgi:hypothetical protein
VGSELCLSIVCIKKLTIHDSLVEVCDATKMPPTDKVRLIKN